MQKERKSKLQDGLGMYEYKYFLVLKPSSQGGGRFGFVELNDGSCLRNLQIVVDKNVEGFNHVDSSDCGLR